jgi:hypothetical protein
VVNSHHANLPSIEDLQLTGLFFIDLGVTSPKTLAIDPSVN